MTLIKHTQKIFTVRQTSFHQKLFNQKCGPPYVYEFGSTLFQIITYEWPFNDKDDNTNFKELTGKGIRDSRIESCEIIRNENDKPLYEIVRRC